MPYTSPPAYTKGLPSGLRSMWTKAWNSAYEYARKSKNKNPFGYAFSVANKVLRGRGYERKDGEWKKVEGKEEALETLTVTTPDYQVMGATTHQLITFHGRLHAMKPEDENATKVHDFVAALLSLRGVKHKDA